LVEEEMALPIEVRKTYDREIEYENKLVLAPMVRTGSCESLVLTSGNQY
jgi:tRNA-dihydrouridine synthase 2